MSTDPAEVYMSTIPSSAELRGLLAKATARPWVQQRHTIHSELVGLLGGVSPGGLADAALIVALVNSAPRLLGALEENERLRSLLRDAAGMLRKDGHRPETEAGGFPGCDPCDLISAIDAALARPHPDEEDERMVSNVDATSGPITREMLEVTRDRPIRPDPPIVLPSSRHPDEEGDSDAG